MRAAVLLSSDHVWIAGPIDGRNLARAVGHRDEHRTGIARCGVAVNPVPVGAYRLGESGQLCPVCWAAPDPRRGNEGRWSR